MIAKRVYLQKAEFEKKVLRKTTSEQKYYENKQHVVETVEHK